MKSINRVLFCVLICSGVVFTKNLDNRHVYDIEYGSYQNFGTNTDNFQYEIVFAKDGALIEENFGQSYPKLDDTPIKKKIATTEKGLCVGSVMLMALCY